MTTYLVRHAKAGKRARWDGDDSLRPLTDDGRAQSEAIAEWLASVGPSALLSSPYVRCRQSLEPLAARIGLSVRDEPALAEGEPSDAVLGLLRQCADSTVMCSHGDVIDDTVELLARGGAELVGRPASVRKATTVVIERNSPGPWVVTFVACPR